jgi:hypothetical protein
MSSVRPLSDELDEHHLNRVSVGCATERVVTECEPPKQLLHHACDGTEPAFACTWLATLFKSIKIGKTLLLGDFLVTHDEIAKLTDLLCW